MKIIDGTNAIMGRLASYVAKQALKGEQITIVNCNDVIITGNKKSIEEDFLERRGRVGSGQRGPKHSRSSEQIVRKAIMGMLPNARKGRGKEALARIRCYSGVPKEFQNSEMIKSGKEKTTKFIKVKDIF